MKRVEDKKTENMVNYRKNYYLEKKEKLKEKVICPDCLESYMHYNKYNHQQTKRHKEKSANGAILMELQKITNHIDTLKNAITKN